ncbi:M20/M25/M40 family metallo-hydrolase [Mobilicoccus caccae]|nr:M20/M25/M40 family metallo-hydrolase [Mobilicoccus caccae]
MKGFIGAALTAIPEFQAARLSEPIHLVLSYDEEVGCHGGRQLVDDLAELGLTPACASSANPPACG